MADAPVGHIIRAARKARGLTQTALARKLGISVSYMNLIERDRRRIAGARLKTLREILDLEAGALDGDAERRILQDLDELAADPTVAEFRLDAAGARTLLARHPDWARALAALRRSGLRDQSLIAALSDRLNHDPELNTAIHEMLNAATAIRSVADIFAEAPDLPPERRARFDGMLHEESKRLAEVAQALAGFFERNEAPGTALTAAEEVDEFLYERRNHFPALEAAMAEVFADPPTSDALSRVLEDRCGIAVRRDPEFDAGHPIRHEPDGIRIAEGVPRATARFQIALRIAVAVAGGAIEAEIADTPGLTGDLARARARRALTAYAAAALLMPYDPFREATERTRYDIDALAMRFGASPEQLCHRFTTLRRPGAEGVPFAFLRTNAAGYLTKRFPLPRFPIPRYGGACPLWAVYAAMQTPDLRHRQLAEFPNGHRFLIVARATRPPAGAFGHSLPSHALMLACDVLNADKLVYGDGLDLSLGGRADPVGSTCLLCPRPDCAHRQEASVRE